MRHKETVVGAARHRSRPRTRVRTAARADQTQISKSEIGNYRLVQARLAGGDGRCAIERDE